MSNKKRQVGSGSGPVAGSGRQVRSPAGRQVGSGSGRGRVAGRALQRLEGVGGCSISRLGQSPEKNPSSVEPGLVVRRGRRLAGLL